VCGSIVKKATGACYGDQESASDALLAAADGDDLMLQIEQLIDPQALQMLTPEWEALDAELSPRTPFTSPLWNILWWKHMRSNNLFVCDKFFIHTVRDSDFRLLAVAPMMLTHRPGVGPLRLRELCFY
jgi:hypothetical protein